MTDHSHSTHPTDPLEELTKQLLACGAVLSQMISHMVAFPAAGRCAPDTAPIPDAAYSMIRDVLGEVKQSHSKRDLRVAAAIVAEATTAICENIFFVGPELN